VIFPKYIEDKEKASVVTTQMIRGAGEMNMNNHIAHNVYKFIEGYTQQHGYPPTIREIGVACFLGPSSVLRYLDKLEATGWIQREPGRARGMTLLKSNHQNGS